MRSGSAGVAASPTLSFSLLRHGRSRITRFISPLSPASSHDSGGTDRSSLQPAPPLPAPPRPAPPSRQIRGCARPLRGFAAGSDPRVVGTTSGQPKAKAAGRGRSVFRAPLSFHCPLGCVVLSLADWLREEVRLGDQKTTNPFIHRDESGRGAVLGVLVLRDWRWEVTKGMVGSGCAFPMLGTLHITHLLYLIFAPTLRGTVVSSLENVLLARDLEVPRW